MAQDVVAFIDFLDRLPAVDGKAKAGVVGYCTGGRMTMQSAAAVPTRIGAGASFHGGGLVTDKPHSPHLLVPRIKARYYIGVAANDDEREPDAKVKLAGTRRKAVAVRVSATARSHRPLPLMSSLVRLRQMATLALCP